MSNHFCYTVKELKEALKDFPDEYELVTFSPAEWTKGLYEACLEISLGSNAPKTVHVNVSAGLKFTKKRKKKITL